MSRKEEQRTYRTHGFLFRSVARGPGDGKPECSLFLLVAVLGLASQSARGDTLSLENERYQVAVSEENGVVTRVFDKVGDLELLQEPRLAENFKFTLPLHGKAAWQATEANYILGKDQRLTSCEQTDNCLTLRWEGPLASVLGKHYDVSATMTIRLAAEEIRFDLKIHNDTPYEIGEVFFPILGGILGLGDGEEQRKQTDLVLPTREGIETSKIFKSFANHSWLGVHGAEQYYSYPDKLSMPWMALHQPSLNRGVSFAACDRVARFKVAHLEMLPGTAPNRKNGNWPTTEELGGLPAGVKMSFVHVPYEAPGKTFEPSTVVLRFHKGGWQTAARAYGNWFASQFDLEKSRQGWMYRQAAFQDCRRVAYRELPQCARSAARYGIQGLLLTDWKTGGHTDGVPRLEPDPKLGTRAELAQAIQQCHELGIKVAFLVNLQTVSQDNDWYRNELQQYACRDRWGITYSKMEGGGGTVPAEWYSRGVRRVWLNPGVPGFRSILVNQIGELARLGADGVHLQDFFARPLDFNPATGNTPDRASWDGGLECLEAILAACRAANSEFCISIDLPWDRLLPVTPVVAVDSSGRSAFQTAFPSWRPTFTIAEGHEFWAINDALRYGGRLRVAPADGEPFGEGKTTDLAKYSKAALGVREALSDTLVDGEFLGSRQLETDPAAAYSTFANRDTRCRTAVLVNPKAQDIHFAVRGFTGPKGERVLLWQPRTGVREIVLPAEVSIPGHEFAILTEEAVRERLEEVGTWAPSAQLGEYRVIFAFRSSDDLEGWSLDGEAFSVNSMDGLFRRATLNSLGRGGESATGTALSPTFTIDAQYDTLDFLFHGGVGLKANNRYNLSIRVLDANTGKLLRELLAAGTVFLTRRRLDVRDLKGRQLQLELVDRHTGGSFAWIGLGELMLTRREPH